MKSKIYLFFIMFLIWCLCNFNTIWVLEKLRFIGSGSSFSWVYFLTAAVFSAIATIWPWRFKKILLFILVAELCWVIILLIRGSENYMVYDPLIKFNGSFFVLDGYLYNVSGYWIGYYSGRLGLTSFGFGLLVFELLIISLSLTLALVIHKLSIWLTEMLTGEEQIDPGNGCLS